MNYIIDPNSGISYDIFSPNGIALLKSYITMYQNGGKSKRKSKRKKKSKNSTKRKKRKNRVLSGPPLPPPPGKPVGSVPSSPMTPLGSPTFVYECVGTDVIFKGTEDDDYSFRTRFRVDEEKNAILRIYVFEEEQEEGDIKNTINNKFLPLLHEVLQYIQDLQDLPYPNQPVDTYCNDPLSNIILTDYFRFPTDFYANVNVERIHNEVIRNVFKLEEEERIGKIAKSKIYKWSNSMGKKA